MVGLSKEFQPARPESLTGSTLRNFVNVQYDCGIFERCDLIKSGDNDTYLLTSGGKKVIARVYQPKPWLSQKSEIKFELGLLQHLKHQDLPISYPFADKDNKTLNILSSPIGEFPIALFSFAPGNISSPMNPTQSHIFGRTIADIHTSSNTFSSQTQRFSLDMDFLLLNPIKCLKKHWENNRTEDQQFLDQLTEKITQTINNNLIHDLSSQCHWGIIGGDFHQSNAHFDQEGKITCFDFDLCGYGWRIYDLATFLWDAWHTQGSLEMQKAFFQGYQSKRELSNQESKVILSLILARQIWYMGTFNMYIERVDSNFYNQEYWNRLMNQLKIWETINQNYINSLLM